MGATAGDDLTEDDYTNVKAEVEQTLWGLIDGNGDGKIERSEWRKYIMGMYTSRAERAALCKIVDAHKDMSHAFMVSRANKIVKKQQDEASDEEVYDVALYENPAYYSDVE